MAAPAGMLETLKLPTGFPTPSLANPTTVAATFPLYIRVVVIGSENAKPVARSNIPHAMKVLRIITSQVITSV
jgi:hypothetical protein